MNKELALEYSVLPQSPWDQSGSLILQPSDSQKKGREMPECRHSKKVECGPRGLFFRAITYPLIILFSVLSLNSVLHSYFQDEVSDILQG